ncbi:MAG: TlpA family protein disulfide reductase [Caldisericaceae bacterium]
MAKKKNKDAKKLKNRNQKRRFENKKILLISGVILGVAIIVVAGVFLFKSLAYGKYTKTITKDEAREAILGYKPEIANPRALANGFRVADSFAVEDLTKDGSRIGEEAIILVDNPDSSKSSRISKDVSMLLIVDSDLKILGLKPFNPDYFTLGLDFDKYFNDYKGKDAITMIKQIDGIYTGPSNLATVIKNKVREAMILFYIEKYGEGAYDALGSNAFVSADKGTKLEPVKATDINGNSVDLSNFKNYKLFILGGNPGCGGCVESVKQLGLEIAKYDTSNVKFIVLSFSSDPADAQKLTSSLPAGAITILDPDRKLATTLKVSSSPYINLVDKDLTIYYVGPGEPMKETLDNIKSFFEGK